MLGDQIYAAQGKRSARRVLSTAPLNVEVSFEEMGKMLGVDGMNIGTYTSRPEADGTFSGEGQGAFATAEGEIVTWKGIGKGRLLAGGALSYRGALTYVTTSSKLAKLNSIAGAFEFDIDAAGNTQSKIWEWK